MFDRIVGYLREHGYIRGCGKQRTDATRVLGLVARLIRLELVWETIWVALGALLSANAPLCGYVREGNTSKSSSFQLRDFDIDTEKRQTICPEGKRQVKWCLAKPNLKNLIAYHVSFGTQCQTCLFFSPDMCTHGSAVLQTVLEIATPHILGLHAG